MRKQPFRAVVSDLDGTLLNANHVVGDFTIDILNRLEQQGVDLILATGRNHTDVSSILGKIGAERAVMITSNGARVRDLEGNLIYSNSLPEDIVLALYKTPFDNSRICLNAYQDEGWFINTDVPELKAYHQDSHFMYEVVNFSQHHARAVEKIFFIGKTPEDLVEVEHYLREHFGDVVNIVYSGLSCLEVMNKNVSKGEALKYVLAQRDYNLEDCIAFGDGMNDVEMLKSVGKGCIMGNADIRLKQACPSLEQIGLNKDEAVAQYLKNMFEIK
ncbi:Cof-type HAD-IIB family hydrolase [Rodentibacter myodis]|uniref:Sugar/pyridoxal phosphate phosphatase YigL n=1 Tax=Rodentibacter myodis TaxID=1907939 RepID=A0A1V3JP12_9PAST|nr:Cof-type HAD-IIB family hydrolase [Rodentibacter myodis]OOF58556.1 hypothetical protein BKL49_06505 [Rodentibacter myodis]